MNVALISPNEPRESGYRVAYIQSVETEVAPPLFWVACPDSIVADEFWYDPSDQSFKEIPPPPPPPEPIQPATTGTQTL